MPACGWGAALVIACVKKRVRRMDVNCIALAATVYSQMTTTITCTGIFERGEANGW